MLSFCPDCGQRVDAVPPFACPHCGVRHWANPKPCAGVLVEHRNEVLLIRRAFDPWDKHWDIPGGFVEHGEHPEDGASRELTEETGLSVPLRSVIGMWMDSYDTGDAEYPLSLLNIYYLAVIATNDDRPVPTLDPVEASEYAWFAPDSLPSPIGFPGHQPQVIERWAAKRLAGDDFGPLPARESR